MSHHHTHRLTDEELLDALRDRLAGVEPDRANQQRLVDLCFSIALAERMGTWWLATQSREEVAKWVAKTLADAGFPTHPVGSSWGVLDQ